MTACAQGLAKQACTGWYFHTALPECVPPPGAAPNGAACRDGGQCQSSHCSVANDSIDGTCAPAPTPAKTPCYVDDDCASGWLCTNADVSTPGQCLQAVGDGSVCYGMTCGKNLDCIPDSCKFCNPPQPKCKPGLGLFTTCNNPYAGQCDDLKGFTCSQNGASYVCLQMKVAPVGGSCTGVCAANATCKAQGDAGSVCVAIPDGGSCDASSGALCMPPAKCVQGTCQI